MGGSQFGHLFSITTFGESHGEGLGVIIEGCPPGIELSTDDIQPWMDRRKPGQSDVSTPRKEADEIKILSGVFEGKTTGTPLAMMLLSTNVKSEDYNNIAKAYRPGHADFGFDSRYGRRDWRGGGRSSARETAARVAAGAVAYKILKTMGISVTAFLVEAAGIVCEKEDLSVIEKNPLRACDMDAAEKMRERVIQLQDEGDSAGGIIKCIIKGVPAGLGDPVFDKLEADLAKGIMSIGAVKGFEIGSGFSAARMQGSQHNDQRDENGFLSNNAGGVIGGISSGQDIEFRVAIKPTSSISKKQKTVDVEGKATTIEIKGRHDPIIAPRAVPVIEAMSCIVIMDHWLRLCAIKNNDA